MPGDAGFADCGRTVRACVRACALPALPALRDSCLRRFIPAWYAAGDVHPCAVPGVQSCRLTSWAVLPRYPVVGKDRLRSAVFISVRTLLLCLPALPRPVCLSSCLLWWLCCTSATPQPHLSHILACNPWVRAVRKRRAKRRTLHSTCSSLCCALPASCFPAFLLSCCVHGWQTTNKLWTSVQMCNKCIVKC